MKILTKPKSKPASDDCFKGRPHSATRAKLLMRHSCMSLDHGDNPATLQPGFMNNLNLREAAGEVSSLFSELRFELYALNRGIQPSALSLGFPLGQTGSAVQRIQVYRAEYRDHLRTQPR